MTQRNEAALVQLKVRMKESLRTTLEIAANYRGISTNAEINTRLERSLDRSNLVGEVLSLAFTPRTAALLLVMGVALEETGQAFLAYNGHIKKEVHWSDDAQSFLCASLAALILLSILQPDHSLPGSQQRCWEEDYSRIIKGNLNCLPHIVSVDRTPVAEAIRELLPPDFRDRLNQLDSNTSDDNLVNLLRWFRETILATKPYEEKNRGKGEKAG